MKRKLHAYGTVLLFTKPRYNSDREKINGVYAAAIAKTWQVLPIDERITADSIRKQIKTWNPIGCIVSDDMLETRLPKAAFGDVPVIILGRDPYQIRQSVDHIPQSLFSAADLAAETLSKTGFSSFAYVGMSMRDDWDNVRGHRFMMCTRGKGSFHAYDGPPIITQSGQRKLEKWLKSLPVPTAVFLATDHLAPAFYAAVKRTGLSIPGDLTVLGTDNVEPICLNVKPTLSSICMDYRKSGENAIELLEWRLQNPSEKTRSMSYGARNVIIRESLSPSSAKNTHLAKALAYIAENACLNISACDVVRLMGCCRRSAEKMFRLATGRTILETIQHLRLERAMTLIHDGELTLEQIPYACGYESTAYFKSLFRKKTGMTMSQWRKADSRL